MAKLIDLAAYAAKYGISQSTLRRRIKSKSIPFVLEKGKYYLKDSSELLSRAPLFSRSQLQQKVSTDCSKSEDQGTIAQLTEENRKLKRQIAELQTFVNVLENELNEQSTTKPVHSPASI